MARITFSLQELVDIAVSNELLPREIIRTRVKGGKIHFAVKTNAFILPFVPASLGYVNFDGRHVNFKLTNVPGPVNKVIGWLQHALKLKIPAFVKLEYPRVSIEIDGLLREKNIRGIQVKDVVFQDGEFSILTRSRPADS
ncbi:MAG: hypothetical protein P8Z79_12510 [Sedimentisphaerales bacterium]|jgi:hypothetical protein